MKFREGKVLEKFHFDKTGRKYNIVFRYPKMSDARLLLHHINSLVEEHAPILANKKFTLKEEKEWLKELITKGKRGQIIAVVIEVGRNVIGVAELRRHIGRKSHVATFGISVGKEYRRLGLSTRVFSLLEKTAGVHGIKIIASCYYSKNKASEKLHKKLGFHVTGRIPNAGRFGKSYDDEIFVYKKVK
jgi:phosphinothricin acetyltransferase